MALSLYHLFEERIESFCLLALIKKKKKNHFILCLQLKG